MTGKIEPLPPELEAAIRQRLAANPFLNFMGIQVPELGRGYARFVLPVRPELHNSQGFLQGGGIAALADKAVAHIVKRGRTISLGEVTVRQGDKLVAKGMCTYIHQVPKKK
jgi:acyl-coenzyme A thioesterase PaaI-like protein